MGLAVMAATGNTGRTTKRTATKKGVDGGAGSAHPANKYVNNKKKHSPGRKRLSEMKISGSKQMRAPSYNLKCEKLQGDFEIYFCQRDGMNDAFMAHFYKELEENQEWRLVHGFLLACRRRTSVLVNDFMTNGKDAFPRKVAVRCLDGEESTPDSRRHMLERIRDFCMREENNRYHYDYIIDEASDLTPEHEQDYQRCDAYIQNSVIMNIIEGMYEDAGAEWYKQHTNDADVFFTGPIYPDAAIASLGYPAPTAGDTGAHSASFNAPPTGIVKPALQQNATRASA